MVYKAPKSEWTESGRVKFQGSVRLYMYAVNINFRSIFNHFVDSNVLHPQSQLCK